ncbi:MAG: hypothetical protein VW270_15155 [Candidatus Poseidoniales archaeon]
MCAVLGLVLRHIDVKLIKNLFYESSIRGLHATGLSYVQGGEVHTIKEPVPARQFEPLDRLEEFVNEDGTLYMIGHCRYSTSDLRFNQPISDSRLSLVHNGVISQELPENWESLYGIKTKTQNDTELLFHRNDNVFEDWQDSSVSAIELRADKSLRFYRNGRRPLFVTEYAGNIAITSTRDIVTRVCGKANVQKTVPGTYYKFKEGQISETYDRKINDLQYE